MSNTEQEINPNLLLWFEQRNLSISSVACIIGVSKQYLSTMLSSNSIPAKRHKQLTTFGVPAEILPPIFTGGFGRPPKRNEFLSKIESINLQ